MVKLRKRRGKDFSVYFLDYTDPAGERVRTTIDIKVYDYDLPAEKENKIRMIHEIRINTEYRLINSKNMGVKHAFGGNLFVVDHIKSYISKNPDKPGLGRFRSMLAFAKDHFGDTTYNELSVYHCKTFLSLLYKELANNTANAYYSAFRTVTNEAVDKSFVVANPAVMIKTKAAPKSKIKDVVSPDEFALMLAVDIDNKTGIKEAAALAFYSGLGYKDCRRLKKHQISNGAVRYRRSKTGVEAIVPLDERVSRYILSHSDNIDTPNVFPYFVKSASTARDNLERMTKGAGIDKHITFYCLRHSFAINTLRSGTNPRVLADYLGHSDLRQVMTYTRHMELLDQRSTIKVVVPNMRVV